MTKSLGLRDNPLGLDFKFLNPGSASAEAEAEEYGSPMQRRGAGSGGPEPPCARPSGWGHCRPRSPLHPPPAPGARGRCVRVRDSRPHPAPASSGPQAPCAVRPAPGPACAGARPPLGHGKPPGTGSSEVDVVLRALGLAGHLGI